MTALYTELLEFCDWDEAAAEELIVRSLSGEEIDDRVQHIVTLLGQIIKRSKSPKMQIAES
jgi:hypothetical protein